MAQPRGARKAGAPGILRVWSPCEGASIGRSSRNRDPQPNRGQEREPRGALTSLLSAFDALGADDDRDVILGAIEVARDHIGLVRAGIFLLDREHDSMLGTWE